MPTFMRQINVISRCGAMYRGEKFKDINLKAPHHSYIMKVCSSPGISQEQLAKHICVDKSNVTRQLSYLEQEGFVRRHHSETDKRVILVYPTQKALDVLPKVKETTSFWNEYITKDFTEKELEVLSEMMGKMAVRAREYFEENEEEK